MRHENISIHESISSNKMPISTQTIILPPTRKIVEKARSDSERQGCDSDRSLSTSQCPLASPKMNVAYHALLGTAVHKSGILNDKNNLEA